jgi:CheY-like chemotaxis protein
MDWHKGSKKSIARRVRSAVPAGQDLDPADHEREPADSGGFADSSLDLLSGVRVSEAPMDTLPGELIDEFFEDSRPNDPGANDLTLTLRSLDEPAAQGGETVSAPIPELVPSDPVDASGNSVLPEVARSVKKAARRAAVRRARLATASRESGAASGLADLLVLDENDAARKQLSSLLEGFGFCVHAALSIAQAREMLAARPFAAVFLDIELDGTYQSAGADLCRRVKRVLTRTPGRAPALIIISERMRPVDRVRAAMAGSDRFLLKPLSRGDVVRALEDCEVFLPLDARRS